MKMFMGKDRVGESLNKAKRLLSGVRLRHWLAAANARQWPGRFGSWIRTYKMHLLKGTAALVILGSISIGGNRYVEENTISVFHVFVNQQEIGVVSDPSVVDDFLDEKYEQVKEEHPNVQMVMDSGGVTLDAEKAFKAESDDAAALRELDRLVTAHAVGTKLIVDGETVAVVKDKETANRILEQMKARYTQVDDRKKNVSIASASGDDSGGKEQRELVSVQFTQNVELKDAVIEPEDVVEPESVFEKLETGGVQPTKYIVQKGDCISCIAAKFGISTQTIYDNNPWIVDDMIQIDDELDITVLQPTLSVKTLEKVAENQEMQYDTEYEKDPNLPAGKTEIIKPGKNGLKKVTYQITRINGIVTKEELLQEDVLVAPVAALAKKGTKVIVGQGTGKFAWPVKNATLTSGFGKRWGTVHKGADLVSSNRNIMAADNGVVIFAGKKNGYGNCIIIDHKNGYQTLYGHLSKITISKGAVVEKGEQIGIMGATGNATGVHLHFEVHVNGDVENPLKFLNK